jgi:lipopolysaccharide export system permease protein
MNRLDRYMMRRWLLFFIPAMVVLGAAYLSSDAAFTLWEYIRRGLSPAQIAMHYILKTPNILYQMAPIASLIATLLTMTSMKRSGEMTAAFVTGIGGVRMSAPILAIAVVVSLLAFYVTESMAPGANRISRDLVRKSSGAGSSVVGTKRIWLLEGNRVIHIRSVQDGGTRLTQPTVLQFEGKGLRELSLRMDAKSVVWKDNAWMAEEVVLRRFTEGNLTDSEVVRDQRLPIRIRPDEFYRVRRKPEEMSISELRKYILNLKAAGLPHITHQVNIYQKVSTAAISLIFTLIALPVAFLIPIRGGVPMGLGLSILLVLIFWSIFSLTLTLGYTGIIPPPLSAWGAQILFLVLGLSALVLIKHPRLT